MSGRNVRWPRRTLLPGESRYMPTGQTDRTDRRTNARPLHCAFL